MVNNGSSNPTIGILYLGELGAALAESFLESNAKVVTTVQNRSERTQQTCQRLGVECLETFDKVVQVAEIVFSVVPPSAARCVAKEYATSVSKRAKRAVFVDLNSVGPEVIVGLENTIVSKGHGFVDAAVHGLAANLTHGAVIYVSGPDAEVVATHIPKSIHVRRIAGRAGAAATFKMLLAGFNKGLVAQFLELCLAAREADLLGEFVERCYEYYPGVMDVTDRLMPSLGRHSRRRAEEMGELVRTIELLGIRPGFANEIRRCFEHLSNAAESTDVLSGPQASSLMSVLDWLASTDGEHGATSDIGPNGSVSP